VVDLVVVRPEVAVRDRVIVVGPGFVHMFRRQRGRKQEIRGGDEQRRGTGQRPNHARIIKGCEAAVNHVAVSNRSETGH